VEEFLYARDFKRTQLECPWVSSLRAFVLNGTTPRKPREAAWAKANEDNLLLHQNLLFWITHSASRKGSLKRQINELLVPQPLRTMVLELAHSHLVFGHNGVQANYQLLKSSYC
jgi:hypothetical protein